MDIQGEKQIVKASELIEYFNMIIEKQKESPIVKIYEKGDTILNDKRVTVDDEFYILFENSYVLIIDYGNIDSLYIEYRQVSIEELEKIICNYSDDFFNYSIDITDYHTKKILRRKASFFEYGNIKNVKVTKPNEKYGVWENNDIVDREPNEETFDNIILELSNGNEIHISPEDALFDGYTDIWVKGEKSFIQDFHKD